MIQYHQKPSTSCCLSSLSSDFNSIGNNRYTNALVNCIEESLTLRTNRFRNIIDFANDIMKNKFCLKGEQHLRYNLKKWKKGASNILNDISENVTLVQLMESIGNVNHSISIVGHWIFDSNYKKALFLTQ